MAWYGVTARTADGTEHEVYDGQNGGQAERLALEEYRRWQGAAYVSVLLDGGTWMDVKHVPGADLSTARLTEPSCCLHPQCGQVNPLSCYCAATMSAEERARWVEIG